MRVLNTKQLVIPSPIVQQPPAQVVQFVKPLSYSFRVAEHVDDEGNVVKVGLQGKIFEHDEFGSPTLLHDWAEIPRVKINATTGLEITTIV
jgi:hypothetical protein